MERYFLILTTVELEPIALDRADHTLQVFFFFFCCCFVFPNLLFLNTSAPCLSAPLPAFSCAVLIPRYLPPLSHFTGLDSYPRSPHLLSQEQLKWIKPPKIIIQPDDLGHGD